MTKLLWDDPIERIYEAGVDRGVLYLDGGSVGVPWNGLSSVDQTFSENSNEAYFVGGEKRMHFSSIGPFSGSIAAYTYPDEFLECEGSLEVETGLIVGNQGTKAFGLSYRTLVGDAVDGIDSGYKIHILYNLTAVPSTKQNRSINDNPEILNFEWDLSSRPDPITNYRPTSYVIIDSRSSDPEFMVLLEELLYGTESTDPELLSLQDLIDFAKDFYPPMILVVDNGDGTWTATADSSYITMLSDHSFQITEVEGAYIGEYTYELTVTG